MADTPLRDEQHSFVVRIWREVAASQADMPAWRGSVDHVGTGHRLYFHDLQAIVRFVRQQVGQEPRRPRHWWAHVWGWIRRGTT